MIADLDDLLGLELEGIPFIDELVPEAGHLVPLENAVQGPDRARKGQGNVVPVDYGEPPR